MNKIALTISVIIILGTASVAQEVFYHISNENTYLFLDELASEKLISINSAVKPYSRKFIAEKLVEAFEQKEKLNKRQLQMLKFYLRDFSKELPPDKEFDKYLDIIVFKKWDIPFDTVKKRPDMVYYRDSLLNITINPVLGISYLVNDITSVFHRRNGADAFAYVGKNFGFYASLRDNYESQLIASPEYLNQYIGGVYKGSGRQEIQGNEYSEMRGGLVYSWKWGSFGLVKDHFVWGNNYNGANIFSGKSPSFAQIKLHLKPAKWLEFNYVHGWLVSDVIDSARSYVYGNNTRDVMRNKYIAANLYTFTPFRGLDVSFGNSIIYSDIGVHPAYLIPFLFFKSVDHTYNSTSNWAGQNSQMFFDISSRQIKHLHLYATLFVDEVYISKIRDKDDSSNFFSGKAGLCISNLIPNVSVMGEYTFTNPIVYEHFLPTTTFESNSYNLGHYLHHNATEIFAAIVYQPLRTLKVKLSYCYAEKGEDYQYTGGSVVRGLPLVESVKWSSREINLRLSYELINDAHIFIGFNNCVTAGEDIEKYTPYYLRGETNSVVFGLNFGF